MKFTKSLLEGFKPAIKSIDQGILIVVWVMPDGTLTKTWDNFNVPTKRHCASYTEHFGKPVCAFRIRPKRLNYRLCA